MNVFYEKDSGLLPIRYWCNEVDEGAMDQAKNLASLPFSFRHIALMPDTHVGYGVPIGGVLAAKNVIIPNAVGVDIGCGMCASKSNILVSAVDDNFLKEVMGEIRQRIPTGFSHRDDPVESPLFGCAPDVQVVKDELDSARKQVGTLGGGNHFIEIQKDQKDTIWVMVHSGSRNFGYKIAKYFHEVAVNLCEKWYVDLPTNDLAYLPIGTKEAEDYIDAMRYAMRFAKESRRIMVTEVQEILIDKIGCVFEDKIDVHHNYATIENHFGENVWIHRKGAISAKEGEIGIIPGSQGTPSYITEGLGNPESFYSSSHGAGRIMGRKEAKRKLDLEVEKDKMMGIIHSVRNEGDLDEAPGAYKDIDEVMINQNDLTTTVHKLLPLAVVKG